MTGRDSMTDEAVRAELERIGFAQLWDQVSNIKATLYAKNGSTISFHHSIAKALRLLAELHAGMGEIAEHPVQRIGNTKSWKFCGKCLEKHNIASKHWKGGK